MKILLSLGVAVFLFVGAPQAKASKASFGCEVLLCLAANQGTPQECKPILKKLYKRLAKGKGFPSCQMESGPDIGGGASNAALPKPERGIARFIPQHKICLDWDRKINQRGDFVGKYCRKEKVIQEHYDHSGKTCRQWFPIPGGRYGAARDGQSDPMYHLRTECQRKSKRFVRITGAGIEGEYYYY